MAESEVKVLPEQNENDSACGKFMQRANLEGLEKDGSGQFKIPKELMETEPL